MREERLIQKKSLDTESQTMGKSMAAPAFQLKTSEDQAVNHANQTENDWVPEVDAKGNVTLRAEEGDNWATLKAYFENSKLSGEQKASLKLAFEKVAAEDGTAIAESSIDLSGTIGGVFSEMAALLNQGVFNKNNCSGTAIPMGKGEKVDVQKGIDPSRDADAILKRDFDSVPFGKAIVGRTVIRNAVTKGAEHEEGQNNRPIHYSIFLGTDNAGNVYVFTKNGYDMPWDIQQLGDFHDPQDPEQPHKTYGAPMPIDDATRHDSNPYYNAKK